MPRKSSHILNRLSRIFNKKDAAISQTPLPSIATTPTESMIYSYNDSSFLHRNSTLPVLLQRAPSSKLLVEDDFDMSSIECSYSYSDIHTAVASTATEKEGSISNNGNMNKAHNCQSWLSTISKLKTVKSIKRKSANKRKSNSECWFTHHQSQHLQQPQQQGVLYYSTITEISDQQQQQNKIKKRPTNQQENDDRHISCSPLSITSSLNSSNTTTRNDTTRFSSSWLPINEEDDNSPSTARTSIDSQLYMHSQQEEEKTVAIKKSTIYLAENVKSILGDAILLADQELDI